MMAKLDSVYASDQDDIWRCMVAVLRRDSKKIVVGGFAWWCLTILSAVRLHEMDAGSAFTESQSWMRNNSERSRSHSFAILQIRMTGVLLKR